MDAQWQHDLPALRKTRIVCISDTHNASPLCGAFKLPKGDVLIHAGDMSNQGSLSELQRTVEWMEKADFEAKIVVAGNHDITLDREFYAEYGAYFHNQHPQDPDKCLELFTGSQTITYLSHTHKAIHLTSPTGPRTKFTIFGSPYSPAHPSRTWAFTYPPSRARNLWSQIPLDTDILVTHTPAKYHLDETQTRRAAGCEELREALWRVRPRVAVCGHIHEGRGAERVKWELGTENVGYREGEKTVWVDEGGKGMALVDLTGKGKGARLDNDGSIGDEDADAETRRGSSHNDKPHYAPSFSPSELFSAPSISTLGTWPITDPLAATHSSLSSSSSSSSSSPPFPTAIATATATATANTVPLHPESAAPAVPPFALGLGGHPPSHRCDVLALAGRLGRRETCIVNAAIMAKSWPHKGSGGKKFNRPIVVDVELPVWEGEGDGEEEDGLNSVTS
ncbi:hypothetical protein FGG08_002770 [Glutinoglossum americanum]|uniref:Calcineurin-like phosphoesterase domain-containing protein n=1 Tax=Glutinoglossum americanum TaxID=1670608 RepID=A0A9P8I932_9PEZI|nr:hypothetical protein FGG08_002770 [Glutinoglossum americanum]